MRAPGYPPAEPELKAAAAAYQLVPSSDTLIRLQRASESPRRELFDRLTRATWGDVWLGRYSPLTYFCGIVGSPYDPRVLYVCLAVPARGADGAFYRSSDVGCTS